MGVLNKKVFLIIFGLIVVLGAFLRLYQLDLKPMHHDEAEEQYYFIEPLLKGEGLVWDYDNKGLAHHYLTFIFVKICGLSAFALRLSAAFFSLLTIILIYFLKDYIGRLGVFISSFFLAVSPFMVYYARQYTTYPFYLFFLILIIILFLNYYKKNKPVYLYASFFVLAIILNINIEALLIFSFIVLSFLYLNYLFEKDLLRKIIRFVHNIPKRMICFGIISLVVSFFAIQSGFFSHLENIVNLPGGFIELIKKSTESGHNKSFFYYFKILYPFELGLLLISFLGFFYFKKNTFSKFLIYWSICSLLIFSFIPYKTNWVVPVVIFPLFLLSGNTIDYLRKTLVNKKLFILIILSPFLIGSLFFTIEQNFFVVNNFDKNKLGYVETSIDILKLRNDVDNNAKLNDVNKILIAAPSNWPIPVYLKDFSLRYQTDLKKINLDNYSDYGILITSQDQLNKEVPGFNKKEYELRHHYFLNVFYRN